MTKSLTLRDQRQLEFADAFDNRPFEIGGILYLCPRFGKCGVGIEVIKRRPKAKVLIVYPDSNIKTSWTEEFKRLKFKGKPVFSTYLSLKKQAGDWDLVILDEVHLMSGAQKEAMSGIRAKEVLALTGTMTEWTQRELKRDLGLEVIAEYPIETAIEEGVVTDYEITIIETPLDDVKKLYKEGTQTEYRRFSALSWVINKLVEEQEDGVNNHAKLKVLRFARMRVIKDSLAKIEATKKVLKTHPDKRILVFCGHNKVADALGCPVYHSGNKNQQVFDDFAEGRGNHLAVCKLGNSGKTYKPLDRVIINYFDSNAENLAQKIFRCMGLEYNNPSKKAFITVITTNEKTELTWLNKALEFLDQSKIKYL